MLDLNSLFDPDVIEAKVRERHGLGYRQFPVARGITPQDLPGDRWVQWDERAAIMEYHGELPRELAEARALDEVARMMEAEKNLKKAVDVMSQLGYTI